MLYLQYRDTGTTMGVGDKTPFEQQHHAITPRQRGGAAPAFTPGTPACFLGVRHLAYFKAGYMATSGGLVPPPPNDSNVRGEAHQKGAPQPPCWRCAFEPSTPPPWTGRLHEEAVALGQPPMHIPQRRPMAEFAASRAAPHCEDQGPVPTLRLGRFIWEYICEEQRVEEGSATVKDPAGYSWVGVVAQQFHGGHSSLTFL